MAMVEALAAGLIDVVGSFHTPQDEEEKRLPFEEAATGAVGLETLLPAAMQLHHAGHLTLPALWRALALNPARLLGLPAGRLAPGAPADLVLFDPDTPFVLDRATLRSKSKNTPYDLRRMQGRVLATWVAGRAGLRAGARMTLALTFLLAYLLGSIPFGVLITRALGLGDLRAIGSGNIGATNVLRTGNKGAAAATLLLDAAKGAVAVLVARALAGEQAAHGRRPRRLPRPPLPGLAEVQGRQGRRHLPRHHAGARLARRPRRLRHLARGGLRHPLLLARRAGRRRRDPALALGLRPARRRLARHRARGARLLRHHANIRRLLDGTEPRIGR